MKGRLPKGGRLFFWAKPRPQWRGDDGLRVSGLDNVDFFLTEAARDAVVDCLPSGRPIVSHLRRCKHAASGLWRQGRMIGYTSCGLGVSDLPVRFNTRGEVTVTTLRRATGPAERASP